MKRNDQTYWAGVATSGPIVRPRGAGAVAVPPTVQVRFSGGPLHGKVLWVDKRCLSLNVYIRDDEARVKRTLLYQKENTMFVFTNESATPLEPAGTQSSAA